MANVDWDAVFDAAGQKYNVDPRLLKRLAGHESGNNPNSRPGPVTPYSNGEQAQGQMQVLPSTGRGLGYDVTDPIQNVFAGAAYVRQGLDATGNVADAIRFYHGGPDRSKWGAEGEKEVNAVLGGYQNIRTNQGGSQPQGTVNNVAQPMPWEEPANHNSSNAAKMPWESDTTSPSSNSSNGSFLELLQKKAQPTAPVATIPESPAAPAPAPEIPVASPVSPAPTPTPAPVVAQPAGVNPFQAAITGAANGALFGYGPQVVGAVQSVNPLTSETYQQARARAQARIDEAKQQHPYAYTAGDLAGNALTATVPFMGEGAIAGQLAKAGITYMPTTIARGLIGAGEGALNASSDPEATPGSVATGAATGAVASSIAPPILEATGKGINTAIDATTGKLMTYIGRGSRNAGIIASATPSVAGAGLASGITGSIPIIGPLGEMVGANPLIGQVIAPAVGSAAAIDVGGRLAGHALQGANTTAGRGILNSLTERSPQDITVLQNKPNTSATQTNALDGLYDQNLAIRAKKLFNSSGQVNTSDVATLLRGANKHDEFLIRKALTDKVDQLATGAR